MGSREIASEPPNSPGRELRLGEGDWFFAGGEWQEDEEKIISPPAAVEDENLAVYASHSYADFEAEFDFRWTSLCCGGGFVFRGRDARRYYLIEFPCTGQQYRAEYFWACVSKVDESGWAKVLKTETLHGVPSEIGLWHHCRLVVQGDEIRLWVDGRPFPLVRDATYAGRGHVGLFSYDGLGNVSPLDFRNVKIRGLEESALWEEGVKPVRNYYYPTVDETHGKVHHLSSVTKTPNGDLLMMLHIGDEFHGASDSFERMLIRSSDKGRTWSPPEKPSVSDLEGVFHTTRDGHLLMFNVGSAPPFSITRRNSPDNGRTWSHPQFCGHVRFPTDVDVVVMNHLIELHDGTLLWTLYRHTTKELAPNEHDYGSFCIRSTDGGRNWSPPVYMDGPRPEGFEDRMMVKKHFGSETSAAQTREGRLIALVRPFYEPVMWETWSEDGGRTWTPASRGPFGMWAATCSMVSTASGALLIAGRHPGLSFQLSYDDGMTWQCSRFDTTAWANGIAIEIEPDLVLYASTGNYGDPKVRVHLFRITPDGPEPVRVMEL